MTHDSTNQHFSLEPNYDGFDPLEDFDDDETDGRADEFVATVSAAKDALARETADADTDATSSGAPVACERPAGERIDDLLKAMARRRTVLLGILAACAQPQPASAVKAQVDELQANNFSVYSAANLCSLLEKAGALERVTADGDPADDAEIEPETVVVDGVEYLEAREPVETYWRATAPGIAALEADKPLDRLRALLEQDAAYAPIYQRILNLCAADGGAATPAINDAVDNDPLVQKPRFYAPHFIDRLEKCDALVWKKTWRTTDIGRAGLDLLADAPATAASKED